MKVRISTRAAADLEEIADWIAADNPARANSFVDELVAELSSWARHPRRFPQRRVGGVSFRKATWRGFLIFYRVLPDRVEIARIIHGSRDWARLLGAGD